MSETTDPDIELFRKFVGQCAAKARDMVFGAGEFRLVFKWMDEPHPDDEPHSICPMDCSVNSVYGYMEVRVYPESYQNWKDGDTESVATNILHEISHIVVNPLANIMLEDCKPSQEFMFRDIVETAVERIAKSIHTANEDWWKENNE